MYEYFVVRILTDSVTVLTKEGFEVKHEVFKHDPAPAPTPEPTTEPTPEVVEEPTEG